MRDELMAELIKKYEKLINISVYLGSTLLFSEVIRRIVSTCCELLKAEGASIILYDEEKDMLYFDQVINEADEAKLKKIFLKAGEGIAGYVAEKKENLIVNDAQSDPRHYKGADAATGKTTRNILAIPINFQGRFLGVMEIINKIEGDFTEEDLKEAEFLAKIAGVSLENAKLHEKMRENFKKIKELEESKTEFVSILSHELYTPLTSISGYTDLLLKNFKKMDEETITDSLGVTKSLSSHLHMLINDLFIINEIDEMRKILDLKETDIREAIKKKIKEWKYINPDYNINFNVIEEKEPEKYNIKIDDKKIGHCLAHLLNNSVKFTENPGESVEVELHSLSMSGKNAVQLIVKDKGLGIEKEYYEKIFDKFFQISSGFARTHDGLGIGLFICRKIVEAHGGSIFCESEPGKGSKFCIQLISEQ